MGVPRTGGNTFPVVECPFGDDISGNDEPERVNCLPASEASLAGISGARRPALST